MQKTALVTGVTGQDGSYLSEYLLSLGYCVVGLRKRSSSVNTERIDHLYKDPQLESSFLLEYGDVSDMTSLTRIISKHQPNEIYNLAAQSHVRISFENPGHTLHSAAQGILFLMETVKCLGLADTRIYQASTSELFGGRNMPEAGYSESSPFLPMSPYGAAKQYAFSISRIYREAYGMFVSNGILFNHESPRRGKNFVTKKVCVGVAKCLTISDHILYVGNLYASRDWGHAKDYVKGMYSILQHDVPDDFVLATGKSYTVKHMINKAFNAAGHNITWFGHGVDEFGCLDSGRCVVKIDPRYFRPLEVDSLLGNPSKAKALLNWSSQTTFDGLISEMVLDELQHVS
jgi:GDPmannose 4,6-dehydratase